MKSSGGTVVLFRYPFCTLSSMEIRLLAAPYDSAIIKKVGLGASVLRCAVAHMLRGQGHKVTEAKTIVHSTFPTEVTTSCRGRCSAVAEGKKQGAFPIVFLDVPGDLI